MLKFFESMDNDLEKVVVTEDKKIKLFKDKAKELGAIISQMTGSGPTVFSVCSDYVSATRIYKGLRDIADRVIMTHTSPNSMVIL